MTLQEYLKPLTNLYGVSTIAKFVDTTPDAVYKWIYRGLPKSESKGETSHRAKLAELAKMHPSTKHITAKGLSKYIGNANGG